MQEIAIGFVTSNPLLVASAVASFIGIALWYLYRGFVLRNYTRIKWFRRLLLPHITILLKLVDRRNPEFDLSRLYVETEAQPEEKAFQLFLDESDDENEVVKEIGEYLISEKFRPEVILTSLAEHPKDYPEMGNFVLTAPEKNHSAVVGYGVFTELFRMFTSKWQLHVRMYYDRDKHRLSFYAHKEYNSYNPIYALRHFKGEEISASEGVELLDNYADDIEEYGVELVE